MQGEGNLSLIVVRCGSKLVDTLAMRSAPGVVITRVRLTSDLCYCCLAVVLRCTALWLRSGRASGRRARAA